MTENTVPRVAKFADIKVGQTIERVRTRASGSTITYAGVVSKATERVARDAEDGILAWLADDSDPRVTLRILADPTPKPLPAWGTLVRVIGGEYGGRRAVMAIEGNLYSWSVEGRSSLLRESEITDWEVIHDPSAPKDDAADLLNEDDHRDRLTADGRRIVWHGRGHWHTPAIHGTWCGHCEGNSLADWNDGVGPLRFAGEVTA